MADLSKDAMASPIGTVTTGAEDPRPAATATIDERLRDFVRRGISGVEVPLRLDGGYHVHAFSTGRLHEGVVAETLDVLSQVDGELGNL